MVGKQETKQISCPKLVATRVQVGSWEIVILVNDPKRHGTLGEKNISAMDGKW